MSMNPYFLMIPWCVPWQIFTVKKSIFIFTLSQGKKAFVGSTNCDILVSGFVNVTAWVKRELLHIETIVFPLDCRFFLGCENYFLFSFRF